MAEHEKRRLAWIDFYHAHDRNARLTCEREADCRASGRYAECRLGDDDDLCST